ncbi:MAG: HlyD family efflux transporter periplasmic adaptor subunit [Planctomycetaceae bacterium]
MNKLPRSATSLSSRQGAARAVLLTAAFVVGLAVVWKVPATQKLISEYFPDTSQQEDGRYILHTAEVSPFRITITENGTIDSLRNATLVNSVEGTTTIISLVPEGSKVHGPVTAEFDGVVEFVDAGEPSEQNEATAESESERIIRVRAEDGTEKTYTFPMGPYTEVLVTDRQKVRKGQYIAGDMVCELDSSALVEKEKQQQISVTTARADLEKAAKTLEIQESTNESLLAQARLAEQLAQLDLEKYTADGGEYQQEVQTIQGDIKKFEEEQAMAQEEYEKVRDQARRGYTNLNSLEAARIKVNQQKILLDNEKRKMNLLESFTKKRTESELRQTAEDTIRETKRVKLEGEAQIAGYKADYDARKLTLQVEEEKLERLLAQIRACRLIASQQGEVVYASQNSRRSDPVIIEEGATVRERQAVINLPDLDQMKVDARIHESRISRISVGQPAEIFIDAVADTTFHGVLENVSSVPVPGNWPNTDLKEYEATVRITDSQEQVRKLKPGMTAEVRIIVDDREEDVLQVPVQCILSVADRYFAYVVKGRDVERREVKVGDANDEYMEILDGIASGDRVVMNPRTHFSREITELEGRLQSEQESARPKTPRAPRPEGAAPPTAGGGPAGNSSPGGVKPGEATTAGEPNGRGPGGGGPNAAPGSGGPGGGGGPPDPDAMLKRSDRNGDGVVTKDESDFRGNFDTIDKDGDGKVTADELKARFTTRP